MREIEQRTLLDADAGKLVDVEEASVVDLVRGHAPIGRAVVLPLDEAVQRAERLGLAGHAVERVGRLGHEASGCGVAAAQRRELGLELGTALVRLLAPAAGDAAHAVEIVGEAHELGARLVRKAVADAARELAAQDRRVVARPERQAVIVIPDAQAPFVGRETQHELAPGQHVAVMVAEQRQQQLALEFGLEGVPVDVEEIGVARALAPLEHIEPPRVVDLADAHMIRNKIEDEAEAVQSERVAECDEAVPAADLGVDRGVVDDVVAVLAARPRLQERRGIDVAYPKRRQIRHDLARLREGESRAELQPIGGARNRIETRDGHGCHRRWRGGRSRLSASARPATRGSAKIAPVVSGSRRRQFGCSSTVPGTLICSMRPSASSSCTITMRPVHAARLES